MTVFLREQAGKSHQKALVLSGGLAIAFLAISLLLWFGLKELSSILIATLLLFVVSWLLLESYYRNQLLLKQQQQKLTELTTFRADLDNQYHQIEAFSSILNLLRPRAPLPPMRGWAISPDFAALLISTVAENQPKLIVEMGSGVSTLVMGYCLQKGEDSKLYTLEHNEEYAGVSKNNLHNHQLESFATIIYSPLQEYTLRDRTWLWYNTDFLQQLPASIDMVVVDGPPGGLQKLSRYPALPLLFEKLSDEALIVLDDSDRPDEQEMIKLWSQEFPMVEIQPVPTEKGACLLRLRK